MAFRLRYISFPPYGVVATISRFDSLERAFIEASRFRGADNKKNSRYIWKHHVGEKRWSLVCMNHDRAINMAELRIENVQ